MENIQINAAAVLKAYQETGLIPLRLDWIEKDNGGKRCACGLSALYIGCSSDHDEAYDFLFKTIRDLEDVMEEKFGISNDFILGFINGFDGGVINPRWTQEKNDAFKIGQEAWQAVYHLAVGESEGELE
ncbi:hypothetical protein [Bacillus sp. 3255]|uniref:hypothetical protein n=1 Tax=Bacillus sp. 3255 TaxID=2817904 RepID=UPI0028620A7A|nr:hypothetical protein [Bacillus sp. 3255]MDR6884879.1 hypothetical protein [Bacillus sp. 3255]